MGRIKDLTTDELLNYVKEGEIDLSRIKYDDFGPISTFVNKYGFHPGKKPISKTLLYKLYKQTDKDPETIKRFHSLIGSYLSHDDRYYYIDNNRHKISLLALNALESNKIRESIKPSYYIIVNKFIEHYGMKSGNNWFSVDFLYSLYIIYSKKYKVRRMKKDTFNYLMDKIFITKYKKLRWVGLNNILETLPRDDKEETIKYLENVNKNSKNEERQKEISRLKQES